MKDETKTLTREQLAELKQYKWNPTHDENICANCSQIVEARADCKWSDGDLCDVCAQTVLGRILEVLPQLLAAAENLHRIYEADGDYSQQLRAELAQERELRVTQLAGISTASIQNTERSIQDRIGRDNPYCSQAYLDVCVAIDREMTLRAENEQLRTMLHYDALRPRPDAPTNPHSPLPTPHL